MSEHACTELTDGCYRCELNRDEIRHWAESLMVTRKGVVHEPDCTFVTGPCSSARPWLPTPARSDRACSRCLPWGFRTPRIGREHDRHLRPRAELLVLRSRSAPHPLPCPGTITVGSGKTQTSRPCPCIRDHTSQEKPL